MTMVHIAKELPYTVEEILVMSAAKLILLDTALKVMSGQKHPSKTLSSEEKADLKFLEEHGPEMAQLIQNMSEPQGVTQIGGQDL